MAGSVRDATRLKQVVATWMHHSVECVVALARGRRPHADGHLTLLHVRVSNAGARRAIHRPAQDCVVAQRLLHVRGPDVPAEDG